MRPTASLFLVLLLCGCSNVETTCKQPVYQTLAADDLDKLEIESDELDGRFANMALIHHTETEFTFDFVHVQPGGKQGRVRARIVTSPEHTKRLIAAMQDNLAKYEAKFKPIGAK
jgi:hypothetical protein